MSWILARVTLTADEPMLNIVADAVFVALLVDDDLLCSESISALLLRPIRVLIPSLRQSPCFNLLVTSQILRS